ncbi:DUF3575 domain-containing protein [Niabella aurantiaca]|uniref:DUF3575 domain-containing protein n=1 Tax=Niabella aurantiaca TaxID=379900 RepID=UPI00036B9036|nr:DUF3575 domain-containing protein [Niabella aurantiaca]
MKINCCFALLLFCITGFAQEEKPPGMGIKLNATAAAAVFDFPTLQLGIEKRMGKHLGLFAEAGYQLYKPRALDTVFVKTKGLKTNIELRRYLKEEPRGRKFYVGGALFYRSNTANDYTYDSLIHQNGIIKRLGKDAFWFKKRSFGVNVITGFDFLFKKWLQVELYGGIGIKRTMTKDFELQAARIGNKGNEDVIGSMLSRDNMRNGWGPNITLGARVGRLF